MNESRSFAKHYYQVIDHLERSKYLLPALLVINAIIKVFTIWNFNGQIVSESGSNYQYVELIKSGTHPALFDKAFRSIIGYIAFYLELVIGHPYAIFFFHVILSLCTIFLVYHVVVQISGRRSAGLLTVMGLTVLMEYHLLTPVLYYQVFEVFFAAVLLWFLITAVFTEKIPVLALIYVFFPLTTYLSVFFRSTFRYVGYFTLCVSLVLAINKMKKQSVRVFVLSVLTLFSFQLLPLTSFRADHDIPANNFIFFGHTKYGGGEGYLKKEYQNEYNSKLELYAQEKGLDANSREVINEFQTSEIKKYIKNDTFSWIGLQVKKIAYTFGIVPIKDNLTLLVSGRYPVDQWLAMGFLQGFFLLLLLAFILSFTAGVKLEDFKNPKILMLYMYFLYMVSATCLYGHYSERYRTVVMVTAILPIASIMITRSSVKLNMWRKIIMISILCMFLISLTYQAYDALVVQRERYIGWNNAATMQ